jgi:phosphate transport system ATP-binding protein
MPAMTILAKARLNVRRRTESDQGWIKIHIKNLNLFYDKLQSLKNVSLDIPEKLATAPIGPSGCAKSPLLRVLNRMNDLYPKHRATGEITMDGENMLAEHINIMRLRKRVGMAFQTPTPFALSIYDNLAFGIRPHERLSPSGLRRRVEECPTRSALWPEVKDRLKTSTLGLSGGQQQRVCIAA